MKAAHVVEHLHKTLPAVTDLFSTVENITSLSFLAGIVSATTATPHDLSTGDNVLITGALTPNPLTSLTRIGNIAYATTANNHDLTQGYQPNVTIQGALDPLYNGIHKLLTVPNRRNFTYEVIGNPPTPDLGPSLLLEDKAFGYNGIYSVTVTGPNTFNYPLNYSVGTPAQGNISASYDTRVAQAISIERAGDMYSRFETNEYWAFVVLDDVSISKDRSILSDAPETFGSGDDFRQEEINPFSVYVFSPSTSNLSGGFNRDSMEDVRVYLYKCLLGVKFLTGLSLDAYPNALQKTYAIGHSFVNYNAAFYVHKFDFENVSYIDYLDTIGPDINVAFRDIDLIFNNFNDTPQIIAETLIDLDDVPLG